MAGAGVKLLNKRIRSVESTRQITKAMKMVAAAKLQRSQGRMLAARPYSQKLMALMTQLSAGADVTDPLFEVREVAKRLFVVVTSDKGMCGSYNMNIIKVAQAAIDESTASGVETSVYAIGKKAGDHFSKRGYDMFAIHDDFNGDVTAERGRVVGDAVVSNFLEGIFDEVRVVYSCFISTMTQRPANQPLLPIAPDAMETGDEAAAGGELDYIWEPDQDTMFKVLLPLYLRNRVYMTLSEAFTSEHAARMTSMTAATQNAGEMIEALTLQRNRERQAAITGELLDIVGGANAL